MKAPHTAKGRTNAAALLLSLAFLGACESASARDDQASGSPSGSASVTSTADAAVNSAADSARDALLRRADLGRIKGSDTASTWLVVISDFQCPFCKVWHDETAPRIDREYVSTGRIRVAYLNLPISTHRNAWPAHESAMCAAEQGKFWPVADAIFRTQGDWKGRSDAAAYFDSLTATIELDHARLRACVAGGQLKPSIRADHDRATRLGVGSTPTFLIGRQVLVGAQPFEAFKGALDAALKK